MGDLRDQLKKANLISKKDAKRLAHEERVHRKSVGGVEGVAKERAEHEAQLRRLQAAQREADREAEAGRQTQMAGVAERSACAELVRQQARAPRRQGASRWHFQTPEGHLPCLEVAATDRSQLLEGLQCVVRVGPAGTHDYRLLAADLGVRVAASLDGVVVWAAPGVLPEAAHS